MSYDAVLFDSDGVLVERPRPDEMVTVARETIAETELDADAGAVLGAFATGDVSGLARQCRDSGVNFATFCQRGATVLFERQRETVESGLRSAYDDITALRSLDRPMGLVSDNHPGFVEFVLDRFGIADLFETVRCRTFSPSGLQRRKPDPGNLRAALNDLAADTESTLHVGDTAVDVAAADRLGIDSALLQRPSHDGPTDLGSAAVEPVDPEYEIEGLDELPGIVE